MTTTKAVEIFCKIIGYAGCVLLTVFSAMFAVLAVVALVTMFTSSFAIGFLGLAASVALCLFTWTIRKDTIV